jgi:hypothetical protein
MIRIATVLVLIANLPPASAQSSAPLSGDYVCAYGCRLTDANPSVAIDGAAAICINEFGGIYRGRVLSETSISCFNKTGVLAADGVTLQWSDGVVWKRRL